MDNQTVYLFHLFCQYWAASGQSNLSAFASSKTNVSAFDAPSVSSDFIGLPVESDLVDII